MPIVDIAEVVGVVKLDRFARLELEEGGSVILADWDCSILVNLANTFILAVIIFTPRDTDTTYWQTEGQEGHNHSPDDQGHDDPSR